MANPIARFTVPGPPRGKGRPRFVKASGRTYTPAKTATYERTVRAYANIALGDPAKFPDGPLRVRVVAVADRPQRMNPRRHPDGLTWRAAKPDADNVAKAVLDALSPWFDDARVCDLSVCSLYAERGYGGRVDVSVELVDGMPPQTPPTVAPLPKVQPKAKPEPAPKPVKLPKVGQVVQFGASSRWHRVAGTYGKAYHVECDTVLRQDKGWQDKPPKGAEMCARCEG